MHIRLCGWMIDKKFVTRPISGNKTIFFALESIFFDNQFFKEGFRKP